MLLERKKNVLTSSLREVLFFGSPTLGRAFGTRLPSRRPFRSKGLPRRLRQMPQPLARLFPIFFTHVKMNASMVL